MHGYPPHIDAIEFARREQEIVGEFNVHRFQRLLEGLPRQPDSSMVQYKLTGSRGLDGSPRLSLSVQAKVVLECQHCLGDLGLDIDHHVTLELVRQESELDRDDLEDDDPDAPEKIVGSPKFDVGELIEDELILEVPYVPKHELCANGASADDSGLVDQPEEAQRPSPFAVLGQLKAKGK